MINWRQFFLLNVSPSGVVVHFEYHVFPPNTEIELRFCFSLRDQQRIIHLNTLLWFNGVFEYCDRGSRLHTFVLGLYQR